MPYGKTDYAFKGDVVLENETMWLFLHSGSGTIPHPTTPIRGEVEEYYSLLMDIYRETIGQE